MFAAPVIAAVVTSVFLIFGAALAARRQRRTDAADKASRVIREHRDPLLRAAFDLQSRLYNLARRNLLGRSASETDGGHLARLSTLWLAAQYLGQVELLRRDLASLDLGSRRANTQLQRLIGDVTAALGSDLAIVGSDKFFQITRASQRAVGEAMVEQTVDRVDLIGYEAFCGRAEGEINRAAAPASPAAAWLWATYRQLESPGSAGPENSSRLVDTQRALIDLIDLLDPHRNRYPNADVRGKMPLPNPESRRAARVARFLWRDGVDVERNLRAAGFSNAGDEWTLSKRLGVSTVNFEAHYKDETLELCAWRTRWTKRRLRVAGDLRSTRSRRQVNLVLARFERPLLLSGETAPSKWACGLATTWRRLVPLSLEHGS